jgi:hypothetical protein
MGINIKYAASRSHTMLRNAILSILLFITLISETFKSTGTTDVYFSPRVGAIEAIVKDISQLES